MSNSNLVCKALTATLISFSSDLNKTSLKNINRKNISLLKNSIPNKNLYLASPEQLQRYATMLVNEGFTKVGEKNFCGGQVRE